MFIEMAIHIYGQQLVAGREKVLFAIKTLLKYSDSHQKYIYNMYYLKFMKKCLNSLSRL